jgi:serine/threonine protein kinase
MPLDTPSLIAVLLEQHLLDGAAENALPELSLTCANPTDLVNELVRRRWLTHFQAELLLDGRSVELVIGQYVLLERLGQGGMGTVYKARHRVLKAVRALKIIHPERLTGPNAVKRFFQEVEAVGKLFHPNIILPHDAGETGGKYFLAMEYVPGADLGRLLDRHGPLPVSDACEYIRQGAVALQHAHERGLVHRDIKPANLLVSSADGRVKLLDLGLARVRALEEEEGVGPQTALTQAGAMMGTPDYMAPEQAVDSHSVDTRADIYALACTLYHILAGRPPYSGGSVMDKLIKHRSVDAKTLDTIRTDVPPALGDVVRKAMAKNPEGRYQTPAEFASALAPFCSGANPAKPRPAGASGEHPIFAPMTRPSLVTVPARPERGNRAPTPPAKPTVTAPRGAMPFPSDRTVTSVETHLDPTVIPLTSATVLPPVERPPPRRRTNWFAVVAMMAVGVLTAGGARLFLARDRGGTAAVSSQRSTDSSPTPPPPPGPVITESGGGVPAPPAPPPPQPVWTAVAKDGGANGTARAGTGPAPKATGRPGPSGMSREPLHQLDGEQVHAVAFSSGGGRAAVVTDTNLDVYNVAPRGGKVLVPLGQLADGLPDPMRTPTAVALSPDGRQAYLTTAVANSAERDGKPKGALFNAVVHWKEGLSTEILFGPPIEGIHKPEFTCVAASPDRSVLAAGTLRSHTASWWDSAVEPPGRREFDPQIGDAVDALAFSPDGKRALLGSRGRGRQRDLCLYTLRQLAGTQPVPLKGHPSGVLCAAFSADGRFGLSGGVDGSVCVWDFEGPPPADGTLRPAKLLSWHQGPVTAVAFAPSGDRFLSGGEDGFLCMGQVSRSGQLLRERTEEPRAALPAAVRAVAFSGDGDYALYATDRSIGRFLLRPLSPAVARGPGGAASAVAKPFATR